MRARLILTALAATIAFLPGCAAQGGSGSTTADEATQFDEPSEGTGDDGGGGGSGGGGSGGAGGAGGGAVAVELPGLPVGGGGVEFDAPSTQCASVATTGFDVPAGVRIVIEEFTVPPEFTVSSGACSSEPPCLAGHEFTSDGATCGVAVTWTGGTPSPDAALQVARAKLICDEESQCSQLQDELASAPEQSIPLSVLLPESPSDSADSSPSTSSPGTSEESSTE